MPKSKAATIAKEARVWELRTRRFYSYEQIAEEVGIGTAMVGRIVNRVIKRHLKVFDEEIQYYKYQQVAQLEHIATEAIEAWERSKEAQDLTTIKKVSPILGKASKSSPIPGLVPKSAANGNGSGKAKSGEIVTVDQDGKVVEDMHTILGLPLYTETTTKTQKTQGDPRYLQVAIQAFADIRKILGLDQPIKVKLEDLRKLSDDELAAITES